MKVISKKEPENRKNVDERDSAKTLMKKDLVNPDFYDISFY